MKTPLTFVGALLLGVSLLAFRSDNPHEAEIKSWHQKRIENLKAEEGWLSKTHRKPESRRRMAQLGGSFLAQRRRKHHWRKRKK